MPIAAHYSRRLRAMGKGLVSEKRGYLIKPTSDAKSVSDEYLKNLQNFRAEKAKYGLPEVDDRFHVWRVPVKANKKRIGEIVIDAYNGAIVQAKTTKADLLIAREVEALEKAEVVKKSCRKPIMSDLPNMIIKGDSIQELDKLPEESVNLVFTSPPYYNAKPEYSEYTTYEEYLDLMRNVIRASARVLSEGRFFVLNVSPVLLRRASRSEASKRIAVPFDFHQIFMDEGFDFIDDIH